MLSIGLLTTGLQTADDGLRTTAPSRGERSRGAGKLGRRHFRLQI
jgi:hypothetical protein